MYTTAKYVIAARNSSRDKAWQNEIMNYVGARCNRYAVPRKTQCNRRNLNGRARENERTSERSPSRDYNAHRTRRLIVRLGIPGAAKVDNA